MKDRLGGMDEIAAARLIRTALETSTFLFTKQALKLIRADADADGERSAVGRTTDGVFLLGAIPVHMLRRTMQVRASLVLRYAPDRPDAGSVYALRDELDSLPDTDLILGGIANANGRHGR